MVLSNIDEMQYNEEHVSKSMYAIFRLVGVPASCDSLKEFWPNLCLAIWTTTPWTIPANAGKVFHEKSHFELSPLSLTSST